MGGGGTVLIHFKRNSISA